MTNDMQYQKSKLDSIYTMLKLTYGLIPVIAGADKFFNILTNWQMYLNPMLLKMIPFTPLQCMYAVGVIEIIAGCVVLFINTRLGAYVITLWLVAISINLISMGLFYDVAVRDIVMAIGALALAQLAELRESLQRD